MTSPNLYLPEDQDILNGLGDGVVADGEKGLEAQRQTLSRLQIQATLRHRKTSVDLDRSNRRFSLAVMFIAVAQLLVSLFQFAMDAVTDPSPKNVGGGLGLMILCLGFIAFFAFKFKQAGDRDD